MLPILRFQVLTLLLLALPGAAHADRRRRHHAGLRRHRGRQDQLQLLDFCARRARPFLFSGTSVRFAP